jgi:Xaa-Pro aminopeptidase
MKTHHSVYRARRSTLVQTIKQQHANKSGIVALFADFEQPRINFRQESSFYYFSGIIEPGAVLTINLDGYTTLYIPHCGNRAQWVTSAAQPTKESAQQHGVDEIVYLGEQCTTYSFSLLFNESEYNAFITEIRKLIESKKSLFTLAPQSQRHYVTQQLILSRLNGMIAGLKEIITDVSPLVAQMRRKKSREEIELIYKAAELTMLAQDAAAASIDEDKKEREIQAGIEYMFNEGGARPGFPSIVAAGANATVLHYTDNHHIMKRGDLVVVDIGAELNYYNADITRTYPVTGTFTKRQRQVYEIVLKTQEYIADLAKPGMWLNNKNEQEKSLHHLAVKFMEKHGYAKYFAHGIGHYLGLDVHDVGDYSEPLGENDVITIEPGIYIPEEKMGIRIEDNYWIIKDGSMCITEQLPKSADDIEELMHYDADEAEED